MRVLDAKNVLKDFCFVSGISSEEVEDQNNLINNLIKIAIDYVMLNIKPGTDVKSNQNLLSMFAATIAYHKYVLVQESLTNNSSVKIGDISINSNSNSVIKSAENLKKEFTSLASHLLLLPNFVFRQI